MCWLVVTSLLSFLMLSLPSGSNSNNFNRGMNATQITGVSGRTARLPCNVTPPVDNDRVALVLWFNERDGKPIFSVEVPDGFSLFRLPATSMWSSGDHFGDRATFNWTDRPAGRDWATDRPAGQGLTDRPAGLVVAGLRRHEAGLYRCRVDFRDSGTRSTFVNLTVIVPADPVKVYDESGMERITFVGPYSEGDDAKLTCKAFGGDPPPIVTWSENGQVVDSTYDIAEDQKTVTNQLTLYRVTRDDLHREIVCTVSNTNLTRPSIVSLHIDVNFGPSEIVMLDPLESGEKVDRMVVGKRYTMVCRVWGSRPPPIITWYLDNVRLDGSHETTDGNVTESLVELDVSERQHGSLLVCRAHNPVLNHIHKRIDKKLDIAFPPNLHLALGSSISSESVFEGGDVYFECSARSNPRPTSVKWLHNDVEIEQDLTKGIIFSNLSLVLQNITRNQSGEYLCDVGNVIGRGRSQPVTLDVKYKPVCSVPQPKIYGVSKKELVNVMCSVEANPPDVKFYWTFNNSAEMISVPKGRSNDSNTASVLSYTPFTTMDFGTIMCYAANTVGKQMTPCVFHIIMAVSPDSVENCTVITKSSDSFHLRCSPGFDGGLNQTFSVQVRERTTGRLRYESFDLPQPDLHVDSLDPGAAYVITVTSNNKKGRSESMEIVIETLQQPEIQEVEENRLASQSFPWEVVAGCAGGGLLILLMLLLLGCHIARMRSRSSLQAILTKDDRITESEDGECMLTASANLQQEVTPRGDRSPDIIPARDSEWWEATDNCQPSSCGSIPTNQIINQWSSSFSMQTPAEGELLLGSATSRTLNSKFGCEPDSRDFMRGKSRTLAFLKEKRESIV